MVIEALGHSLAAPADAVIISALLILPLLVLEQSVDDGGSRMVQNERDELNLAAVGLHYASFRHWLSSSGSIVFAFHMHIRLEISDGALGCGALEGDDVVGCSQSGQQSHAVP